MAKTLVRGQSRMAGHIGDAQDAVRQMRDEVTERRDKYADCFDADCLSPRDAMILRGLGAAVSSLIGVALLSLPGFY